MNLLVTNTYASPAYSIIRALRPYANRIVATLEGENRWEARFSQAAYSRCVDKRYAVPSPGRDWRAGRIQRENTPCEEAFVQALMRICEEQRIDVIFPSLDPHVYVLSKNKGLFAGMGVTIPVPDYDTVLMALDKYRTIQVAEQAGFPYPRTCLYEPREDLKGIAEQMGFPLVIKPRCSAGSRGMAIVKNYAELVKTLPVIVRNHGHPLIQEYIPGKQRQTVDVLLDRNGDVLFAFQKKILRNFRVTTQLVTVSESLPPDAHLHNSARLVQKLGWWGSASVGTLCDPRDGVSKLMEINPRFSQQLWHRTEIGINEPWMSVQVARKVAVEPVDAYPAGILLVSPIEDVQLLGLQVLDLLLYKYRSGMRTGNLTDPLSPPLSLRRQLRSFMQTYLSKQERVFDPYCRYFFQDPLVAILWWARFATWILGTLKHLGK